MSSLEDIPVSTPKRTPPDSLLDHVVRCDLRKLIIFNSIILIVSSFALFTRIITDIVQIEDNQKHHERAFFVFEIHVLIISLSNALFGLTVAIYEHRQHVDHRLMDRLVNFNRFNFAHLLLNAICALFFSFVFILEFIRWCRDLLSDDYRVRNCIRLLILVSFLVLGLCQTACAIGNRVLAWSPQYRYARLTLFISSTILMMVSIASILFNTRVTHLQSAVNATSAAPLGYYRFFQVTSSHTLVCGLSGVALSFACARKTGELHLFHRCARRLFNLFCGIILMLVITFTIIFWPYHTKFVDQSKSANVYTIARSNPFLSGLQGLLLLLSMISLYSLARGTRCVRNVLTAERIQLSQTPAALITQWAIAIDECNPMPGGMTGDAALQLMTAYENGKLENVECLVLRVRRFGQRILISGDQWDDTEALVLLTIIHDYDVTKAPQFDGYWGTIFKRIAGSIQRTTHFYPFVLRLGLLGYQWPFRTGIFFTTFHPDALLRAAHVLESIADWNATQKKGTLHCDALILPTFSTELTAKAIPIAGFFPLPLPPTHLLDLRPHHGKTWDEYMQTLKKDNRRSYIERFLANGGTIEEVHDFSSCEVGATVCRQWTNIARRRRENKEPETLAKPSTTFISSVGETMKKEYRSILFLRLNNEIIASAVIYRFPHRLMTVDLPGLTHEKARPVKAYFVMLYWAVREALEKKYDFMDFGPTTPGPKIDLGCVPVPLEAGGYADNPILAFAIQQAGSDTDDVHRKTNSQHPSGANRRRMEEDQAKFDTQSPIDEHNLTHPVASNVVVIQKPHRKPKHVKQMKKVARTGTSSTNSTNVPRVNQSETNGIRSHSVEAIDNSPMNGTSSSKPSSDEPISTSAVISMLLRTSTTDISVPQLLSVDS